MADVKVVETKKIMIESEAQLGTYKPRYSPTHDSILKSNMVILKATFDAIQEKFIGKFRFSTTKHGKWFEISTLDGLYALRDVINEVIEEANKLSK